MSKIYDVGVVGLGGVGSAAVFALAKRGYSVIGFDQFSPPHPFGSSHGETRIIRKSYFEHPSYVPLLCRAYALWRELESQQEKQLYHPTGLLEIGPDDGLVIPGVLKSAAQFDLPIERFTMPEAKKIFPGLQGNDSWSVVFEKDAGYLNVEACVQAHLECSANLGATLVINRKVIGWEPAGDGVRIRTQDGDCFANKLILAGGPWAGKLLAHLQIPLQILHKHLYWFEVNQGSYHESNGFPCFFFETPTGHFYGFPQRDDLGLKVARHSGGQPAQTEIDGCHVRNRDDESAVETFLEKSLPDVSQRMTRWSGCYYTMTPDEHFIVDTLPHQPQVTVVAGLSGHGFKFTSVLGELAADLATDQSVSFDIDFLKLSRFLNAK